VLNEKDLNEYDVSFDEPFEKVDSTENEEKSLTVTETASDEQKPKGIKPKKHKSEANIYNTVVIQKTRKGKTGVSFDGYGISIPTDKPYNVGDAITLEYTGTIGTPDYKCWQV